MVVQSLPRSFNPDNEITPPVYSDHFLFAEQLRQRYECAEYPAGIGLLAAMEGRCDYFVNGAKQPIDGTRSFFINRGSRLAVKVAAKDSAPALLFFRTALPDLVQHSLNYGNEVLLDEPFDNLPYDFSYLERTHLGPRLHETVASLIELGSSCSAFSSLSADLLIRHLFEDLLRANRDGYKLSQNIQAAKVSTRLEIFRRVSHARDWMEENYGINISLEDIAAEAAMNSQHFLRMFKQVYLITPHQYLIERKLKKARQLLESTEMTINEICQAIGFESVFSFSILFKNRFG
ncbi:MAG TPA: AraC family transcriptional regulator, partial [Puia sp.]|nr:AraC family transcriptional regulator [Puia sp.]